MCPREKTREIVKKREREERETDTYTHVHASWSTEGVVGAGAGGEGDGRPVGKFLGDVSGAGVDGGLLSPNCRAVLSPLGNIFQT
jgi:hypothetical protein